MPVVRQDWALSLLLLSKVCAIQFREPIIRISCWQIFLLTCGKKLNCDYRDPDIT